MVGWPSGPRRQFKALVSSEAWVRIPLQSFVPVSLVGQDTRLSPVRPGFKSRTGNIFFRTKLVNLLKIALIEPYLDRLTSGPPELRWQSGRLLTARSSVRSRVEAHYFFFQYKISTINVRGQRECMFRPRNHPGVAQW